MEGEEINKVENNRTSAIRVRADTLLCQSPPCESQFINRLFRGTLLLRDSFPLLWGSPLCGGLLLRCLRPLSCRLLGCGLSLRGGPAGRSSSGVTSGSVNCGESGQTREYGRTEEIGRSGRRAGCESQPIEEKSRKHDEDAL
jgi:hypothetical protein